jgi:hypothetical protein
MRLLIRFDIARIPYFSCTSSCSSNALSFPSHLVASAVCHLYMDQELLYLPNFDEICLICLKFDFFFLFIEGMRYFSFRTLQVGRSWSELETVLCTVGSCQLPGGYSCSSVAWCFTTSVNHFTCRNNVWQRSRLQVCMPLARHCCQHNIQLPRLE